MHNKNQNLKGLLKIQNMGLKILDMQLHTIILATNKLLTKVMIGN
jgi:hypothetical protein